MITELSPLEKARRAYSDLWDRYINLLYGHTPKNIIITQQQADHFIYLTTLEEFQQIPNWQDVLDRSKEMKGKL